MYSVFSQSGIVHWTLFICFAIVEIFDFYGKSFMDHSIYRDVIWSEVLKKRLMNMGDTKVWTSVYL